MCIFFFLKELKVEAKFKQLSAESFCVTHNQ